MVLWRSVWVCGLLAISLLPGSSGAAGAEWRGRNDQGSDTKGAMAGVAVVDMNRLYNESDAAKEYDRHVTVVTNDAQQRLKIIAGASQLAPNELEQFTLLVGSVQPTEMETKRLKELQDLSDKRADEFRQLQGKADCTAAEKARLQALADQERLFLSQLLPNLKEGFREEANARLEDFRTTQMAQIRTIVGQVAKQKGITHVFDISVLVYCENDLTDAVLQRLKKKK